ncbi:hypothetical protein EKH77_10445 [Streptomyces luteoverticillatus]|uniref:Lipoprotein n=1 Tax=Streptomyces luteoverticillatus TaxID=66425 RepID=A0A3S9PGS7_STRLT|nr:hypothetical protein [Streptomyces luteoverticillatus]AZQ71580.1 hypothetical protein EKH77_10445 [Streptomyces luteoverticillatus]
MTSRRVRATVPAGTTLLTLTALTALTALTLAGCASADRNSATRPTAIPSATTTPSSSRHYRLTTPDTILDGRYKKAPGEDKDVAADQLSRATLLLGVTNGQRVHAVYTTELRKDMSFTGIWGRVEDPERSVDMLFLSSATAARKDKRLSTFTWSGSPQRLTPDGLGKDTVLKCQGTRFTLAGTDDKPTHIRTLCAWADHDTVGTVSLADASFARYGRDIPLDRAAELTAGLRHDTRAPVPR